MYGNGQFFFLHMIFSPSVGKSFLDWASPQSPSVSFNSKKRKKKYKYEQSHGSRYIPKVGKAKK